MRVAMGNTGKASRKAYYNKDQACKLHNKLAVDGTSIKVSKKLHKSCFNKGLKKGHTHAKTKKMSRNSLDSHFGTYNSSTY